MNHKANYMLTLQRNNITGRK